MDTVTVRPFYGWGWFDREGAVVEVPPPFEVSGLEWDPRLRVWIVRLPASPPHPLAGQWIAMSSRHSPPDADANISVHDEDPRNGDEYETPRLSGFALVDPILTKPLQPWTTRILDRLRRMRRGFAVLGG